MSAIRRYLPGSFIIAVSLFFLIASLMLDQDITNPGEGSFLPAFVSIIMLLAGVKVLLDGRSISSNSIKTDEMPDESDEENLQELSDNAEINTNDTWVKKDYMLVISYFGLVVLYVVSLPYLSFFVATFLFLVISMFCLKGVSLVKNLSISVITVIVIYVLFKMLFKIVFP